MSSLAISSIVFGCIFAGILLGMLLRALLPEHHLSTESKDVVKLGAGLIATMSALVLSLMVASAKSSYDAQRNEMMDMSVKVVLLDEALTHYGPPAKEARALLRVIVTNMLTQIWPGSEPGRAHLDPRMAQIDALYGKIQELSPKTDMQRSLQTQSLGLVVDIEQTRWLLFQQADSSISTPFLFVLAFWLSITFSLFAPGNATVIVTPVLCALSVSGALFLILELDHPFQGMIQISSTPLRNALEHLGQ